MISFKNNYLVQAWLVLFLSIIFSVALATVQFKLNPIIEENKTKETMKKIPLLLNDEVIDTNKDTNTPPLTIKQRTIKTQKQGVGKTYIVYDAFDINGNIAGHVVKASGQGYGNKIELLLALDATAKTIKGISIIDQKETPGLGDRIVEDSWRGQFKGKPSEKTLVVIKGKKSVNENEIDAISGATISSRGVTDIVNSTINDVRADITLIPESYTNMEKK
jgi:Na+-translocating ferredoxin:NAD+ oxidoreductase subunit G